MPSLPSPSPSPTNDAIRGLSAFGLVFFLLNVLAVAVVHNLDLDVHRALVIEDGWIEYLTAVYLLAAGIALFGASWVESSRIPRILLLIGGVAMLVGAGEEISWGQRIFDYATPDFLADVNRQGEFNVHNIPSVESADIYAAASSCCAWSRSRPSLLEERRCSEFAFPRRSYR